MVEYKTMVLSLFKRGAIPAGFSQTAFSGETAWNNNPTKRAKATKKAKELIKKFDEDKAARASKKCDC